MNITVRTIIDSDLPVNANPSDTGYDVIAASDPVIVGKHPSESIFPNKDNTLYFYNIDYIEYDLGIKTECGWLGSDQIPYLLVFPRSSSSKYNLLLCNSVGVIDHNYRNTIKVRFKYIFQPEDLRIRSNEAPFIYLNQSKIYKKGDKVAQLVGAIKHNLSFIKVDSLSDTDRGINGFGSTGQ